MKIRHCLIALFLFGTIFTVPVRSQEVELIPQPHQFVKGEKPVIVDRVVLRSEKKWDADALHLIRESLPIVSSGTGLPLTVSFRKGTTSEMKRSGAYTLSVDDRGIRIEAVDDRGLFYAAQTLSKLTTPLSDGRISIVACSVRDYPDVLYRGTVEGFYGEPWSYEDRIEQLRFYGKLKLNTYIYGPKDDPYHSSPNWREAYPAKEANQIRSLVEEANRNKVDFVWAIHPGKDIQWNRQDSSAILHKFDLMYGLGVRSFAVFFDDIAGEGTNPEKQAGLLNYIQQEFVARKKDVNPLIMCPTEYNKAWSNPKRDTYLDILGNRLHPSIHIMWTGNSVISDITKEGLEWVNERLKRPAYVWWNFPVSDYVRDHLLMGAAYGLDSDISGDMSGFVSNPMDKAEASKVGIFGVAMYAWNMAEYDPQKAWEQACAFVMPEAPLAFETFCSHNSDPGFNYHRYRREESAETRPVAEAFLNALRDGRFDTEKAAELTQTFHRVRATPEVMNAKSRNRRLLEQLHPWMLQFERLGEAGITAMEMVGALANGRYGVAWNGYLRTTALQDSMLRIDASMNQNPYQPGVKTGSKVLTPFVNELVRLSARRLLSSGTSDDTGTTEAALYTDQEKLMNMPAKENKNSIGYTPVFEVLTLKPGQYIGVRWEMQKVAKRFEFNLPYSNVSWRAMEWSADGKTWKTFQHIPADAAKGKVEEIDSSARYIRMRNQSDQNQQFYLSGFTVTTADAAQVDEELKMYDKNLNTVCMVAPGTSVEIPNDRNEEITLFTSGEKERCVVAIEGCNEAGERVLIYLGDPGYVLLDRKKIDGFCKLVVTPCGKSSLFVHEVRIR